MFGKFPGEDESDTVRLLANTSSIDGLAETYEVWISRDEMVDFLLYAASLDASVATRSKMSEISIRVGQDRFESDQLYR